MIKLPSYLQRNQYGIFYFRIAIPKALQVHFPKREIKVSLRTSSRSEAIVASKQLAFNTFKEFSDIQGVNQVGKKDIAGFNLVTMCNDEMLMNRKWTY